MEHSAWSYVASVTLSAALFAFVLWADRRLKVRKKANAANAQMNYRNPKLGLQHSVAGLIGPFTILPIGLSFIAGISVIAWQCIQWLKLGMWQSFTLNEVLQDLKMFSLNADHFSTGLLGLVRF